MRPHPDDSPVTAFLTPICFKEGDPQALQISRETRNTTDWPYFRQRSQPDLLCKRCKRLPTTLPPTSTFDDSDTSSHVMSDPPKTAFRPFPSRQELFLTQTVPIRPSPSCEEMDRLLFSMPSLKSTIQGNSRSMPNSFGKSKGRVPETCLCHDSRRPCVGRGLQSSVIKGDLHRNLACVSYLEGQWSLETHSSLHVDKDMVDAVDLRRVLLDCVHAMSGSDRGRKAWDLIKRIRRHATPLGTASQRVAHYFAEALIARLAGNGAHLYTRLTDSNIFTSAVEALQSHHAFVSPFPELSCYFVNFNILKAAEGVSALHIVDYGILHGFQWLSLIHALANRKGGPPRLIISGIEFPLPGARPAEGLEDTGRRLAAYAKSCGVPFEFQAVATSEWAAVDGASLRPERGLLVVCSVNRLRHLMDETVKETCCPRQQVLDNVRKMNPDVYVQGVVNAGCAAPFFEWRFREALFHYSSIYDMLGETMAGGESSEREVIEREYGRQVLSVVACEGEERLERPETYRQWQSRTLRAGFRQVPLDGDLVAQASKAMHNNNKNIVVEEDGGWLVVGWKGRILHAFSCWHPHLP